MKFNPCVGNCTQTGTYCEGCGRSHQEIAETREVIKGVYEFIRKMEYENPQDFVNVVAAKVMKQYQRDQEF